MNTELDKWIEEHQYPANGNDRPEFQRMQIRVVDLRALFAGKVLVPVERLTKVECGYCYDAGSKLDQPYVTIFFPNHDYKARDEFAAMITASQEPKQ